MTGHFVETCALCQKVISQCRCPLSFSSKTRREGLCDDCKKIRDKLKTNDAARLHYLTSEVERLNDV